MPKPTPPPALPALPDSALTDLTGAVPLRNVVRLPNTSEQYRALKAEVDRNRSAAESAKDRSARLKAEAGLLRRQLTETVARVQSLEEEKGRIDATIARLVPEEHAMEVKFAGDRIAVARLLAVLERLQSDMPPVIALKADDALAASRASMVLGASLPRIYQAAARLSQRLKALRRERAELLDRRRESARNAAALGHARLSLDQLLAMKAEQADEAAVEYGTVEARLQIAAEQADTLESLLTKVAALRTQPLDQRIVVVSSQPAPAGLQRGMLVKPVAGPTVAGSGRTPGLTYFAAANADVVAPSDGEVLFAGPYHKMGKVLILEMGGGYDLVLAGLDATAVRVGDEVLAGEPVGNMPHSGPGARLYFELRQNGKGVNPTPWMEVDLRKAKRS